MFRSIAVTLPYGGLKIGSPSMLPGLALGPPTTDHGVIVVPVVATTGAAMDSVPGMSTLLEHPFCAIT